MTLNNMIRRVSSSKVVSLTFRKAGGSERYHHHCSAILLCAVNRSNLGGHVNIFKQALPSSTLHRYSAKSVEDESFIQILNDKIEKSEGTEAKEIPEGFPFQIVDDCLGNLVILTGKYQGETVHVEVYMPNEDDEDEQATASSKLSLVVSVSKEFGPKLERMEFICAAYPDEISIDNVRLISYAAAHDSSVHKYGRHDYYETHNFADLDVNIQKAFHKYLGIRGIKPSNINFLPAYMSKKDGRKYVLWLEKVKKFLQI